MVWTSGSPGKMALAVNDYKESIVAGLFALAQIYAAKIEAYAKQYAPWRDDTAAARQGLRAFAERTAREVVIYLVHSVFYGIFLELRGYAIIGPAMEAFYGEISVAIRALTGGR